MRDSKFLEAVLKLREDRVASGASPPVLFLDSVRSYRRKRPGDGKGTGKGREGAHAERKLGALVNPAPAPKARPKRAARAKAAPKAKALPKAKAAPKAKAEAKARAKAKAKAKAKAAVR